MEDDERIARVRVLVEALGQQDVRAEVHRPAPELRQPLGLDLLVLDVLRRRRIGNRRDRPGRARSRRSPASPASIVIVARRRVQVARRLAPLLSFAAVHRQLHDVAVGAVEGLVAVEERLNAVGARRNVAPGSRPDSRGRRRRRRPPRRPSSPSTSMPKICCVFRIESLICLRGSSFGSVESISEQASVERRGAQVRGRR